MEKFISFLIDVVDKNYHQKKIFKFLDNLNIKITFDIGAHKGEFLKSIKQLKKFNKIYAFEPQKKIYNKLQLLNEDNKIICLNLAISNNSGIKNLKINKIQIRNKDGVLATYKRINRQYNYIINENELGYIEENRKTKSYKVSPKKSRLVSSNYYL